uniref:Uncharacterized protein n=1 Tax=Physcomitrium patens TaxID=3218 RepID=A0A2K1IDI1_PHYPA|nr:hypothetical protein PHYPA_029486 [Physcomitrium patens]
MDSKDPERYIYHDNQFFTKNTKEKRENTVSRVLFDCSTAYSAFIPLHLLRLCAISYGKINNDDQVAAAVVPTW